MAIRVSGRHVWLIARHWGRHSVRGGSGLVFLFLTLVTGLIIASVFIDSVKNVQQEMTRRQRIGGEDVVLMQEAEAKTVLDTVVEEIGRPAIKWAIGGDAAQADYLVREKPALISAVLIVFFFALPFLVSFGSFNQFSGDLQHRGLRYLLLRTDRGSLFLGRFLGSVLFMMLVLSLLVGVLILYLVLGTDLYPKGEVTLWMLQGLWAMILFCMPYIALCSWMSASVDSPFGSLLIGQLLIGFVPMMATLMQNAFDGGKYLAYLTPWPLKYQLLHPSFGHLLGAWAAMLGYTALFVYLGLTTLQKRDV